MVFGELVAFVLLSKHSELSTSLVTFTVCVEHKVSLFEGLSVHLCLFLMYTHVWRVYMYICTCD